MKSTCRMAWPGSLGAIISSLLQKWWIFPPRRAKIVAIGLWLPSGASAW
jgi:hypothetical protein